MANPTILGVAPADSSTDIDLASTIIIQFDQVLDTTTLTAQTFSLTGPGQTAIVSPSEFIADTPSVTTGREYITGSFSYSDPAVGNTRMVFTPDIPLQPNTTYQVLVSGTGITNLNGETLNAVYQWSFTTAAIVLPPNPIYSPIPPEQVFIDPAQIQILQNISSIGNDLTQEIDIVFPDKIDPNSFDLQQIKLSIQAILNNPLIQVPAGLEPTVTVVDNLVKITITGWPAS